MTRCQVIKNPSPQNRQRLAEVSKKVAASVTQLLQVAEAIKGNDFNRSVFLSLAANELRELSSDEKDAFEDAFVKFTHNVNTHLLLVESSFSPVLFLSIGCLHLMRFRS